MLFLLIFKRCELCPHKDGALKRTDNGGESFCAETMSPRALGTRQPARAQNRPFLSLCHQKVFASPGWAHVVCALYIPEVQFANVLTMEPIVLQYVPHDRFNKVSPACSLLPTLAFWGHLVYFDFQVLRFL